MALDLSATLTAAEAAWKAALDAAEAIIAAQEAQITADEKRVTALEAGVPAPVTVISNPSIVRTVGPQVVTDTGWQDLESIFGTFATAPAVDGDTGALNHAGTLYMYCDVGSVTPSFGLRVDNIGNSQYKQFYYPVGGKWTLLPGANAVMNYGKALTKQDRFTAQYRDDEGVILFFINDVQVHRIVAEVVATMFPGGPGRFARYVKGGGTDNIKTTFSSSGGAPLRILAVEPHFAGRGADIHIGYSNAVGQSIQGWDARLPDGSIVACSLTENLRPGRAKITIPDAAVSTQFAGTTLPATIVQRGNSAVALPTEYVVTDKTTWGINVAGHPRPYNNLAATYWRGDGYGRGGYDAANAPYIDTLTGDILSFEDGVNTYLIKMDPVAEDCLVRLSWDGDPASVTISDLARNTSNLVRNGSSIEFNLKANADALYVSVPKSTWSPANPVRNIWCSEIATRGGPYIDQTTWHPAYVTAVSQWKFTRFMDLLGVNSYYTGFDNGILEWKNRRQKPLGLFPRNARIFIPTSNSTRRLALNIRPYASHTFIAKYLPNRHWYGSKGNNWSVTVLPASGSGSITINDQNVIITPPSAGTVQSVINLLKSTPETVELFDIGDYEPRPIPTPPLATVDTVPPMAKTNLRDGVDADPARVTFEDLADLFKRANLEPYINLHVNCTPDFATRAIQIVTDVTGKVCRAEHGNEAFNLAFPGSLWYGAWAVYRGTTETNILAQSIDESCYRARPIFAALKQTFGAKVRTGMGSMAANPSVTAQILNYPGMTKDVISAVFIAPYFNPTFNQPDDAVYVDGAYKNINAQMEVVAAHKQIATPKGIAVETYEVGQHALDSDITNARRRQRSPEMKALYGYYLGEFQRIHGFGRTVPFYHYHWISMIATSQSGAWGLIEYLGQPRSEAPKMDAYLDAYDGVFPPYIRYGASIRILGTRAAGQTVTLDVPPAFNTRSFQIQWTLDGVPISGQSGWSLALTSANVNKKLGVNLVLVGDKGYTKALAYQDSVAITA
jgi:hypothetical protein